jgi:hypothetical protein
MLPLLSTTRFLIGHSILDHSRSRVLRESLVLNVVLRNRESLDILARDARTVVHVCLLSIKIKSYQSHF